MKTIKRNMLLIVLSIAVAICGAMTVLTAVTQNDIHKVNAEASSTTEESTLLYFGNIYPTTLREVMGSVTYDLGQIGVEVYAKKECIDNGGTINLTFIKGGEFYSLENSVSNNPSIFVSGDYYKYSFRISALLNAMNIDVQVRITLSYNGVNHIIESNDINLRRLWKNMAEKNTYEQNGFTVGVDTQFIEVFANSYYNGFYEEATSLQYFSIATSESLIEYDLLSFDVNSLPKYIFKIKSPTIFFNATGTTYHIANLAFYGDSVSRQNGNKPFDDNWPEILNAFYLGDYVYIQIKGYNALIDMLGGLEKIKVKGYDIQLAISPTDAYINSLKTNIENLKNELNITENECERLEQSLTEKSTQITKLNEDITKLNSTITTKDESIQSLNNQINTLNNNVKTLEAAKATLQKQYDDKVNELATLQTEYDAYKVTATSKYADYENQISALKTERTNLNAQIVTLTGDLSIANAKLETATANLENKKKELNDLQAEYDAFKKTTGSSNEVYEEKIAALTNEKTALEGEKIKLENQIMTLTTDLETANKLNDEKIAKISKLETEYNNYKTNAEAKEADYKKQIQSLNWDKTQLNASVATLNSMVEEKNLEIESKQENIASLNEEIEYLNAQVEEKQKAYDEIVNAAGSDKADLLNALTTLRSQNEQLDALNRKLQAENEELKQQTSDTTKKDEKGFSASCSGTIMNSGNIILFSLTIAAGIITLIVKSRKSRNEND